MRAASQLGDKVNPKRIPNKIAGGLQEEVFAMPDRRDGDELAGALAVFAPLRHLLWLRLLLHFRIIVPP